MRETLHFQHELQPSHPHDGNYFTHPETEGLPTRSHKITVHFLKVSIFKIGLEK
jgi:hypothetical protein